MALIDLTYNRLCKKVLDTGFVYEDKSRAHIKMLQIPHYVLEHDMQYGLPILTNKKMFWEKIAHELVWMLSGSDNINYLIENGVNIWTKDVKNFMKKPGNHVRKYLDPMYAGKIYGYQWRRWDGEDGEKVDQIANLIKNLKENPFSRRHLVTAWNPGQLHQMCLPPCHFCFEIIPYKNWGAKLCFDLKWHQRSCDLFLGIPFDLVLYGFLGLLIQRLTGYKFGRLIGDLSNIHFYEPHIKTAMIQMERTYHQPAKFKWDRANVTLENLKASDFQVFDYKHESYLKAEMFPKVLE